MTDESDEEFLRRVRGERRLGWLIPLVVIVALFGGIALYVFATMKPSVKQGDACDKDDTCEGSRATCLYDSPNHGYCTTYCDRVGDPCADGVCDLADTYQGDVQSPGKVLICVPKRMH